MSTSRRTVPDPSDFGERERQDRSLVREELVRQGVRPTEETDGKVEETTTEVPL